MFFSFIVFACNKGGEANPVVSPLESQKICEIDQSKEPLAYLNSLAVCNDKFILCTGEGVREYNYNGKQERDIGNIGRAAGEYVMPMATRTDGRYIYVWSAMNLKFLIYDMEGRFVGECPYGSAIFDFLPVGNLLCIYTAGARAKRIIDIYDISKKEVIDSLVKSSPSHRTFSMVCNAPMTVVNDKLYFMPRDEMKIYSYNLGAKEEPEVISDFHSNSFKVPDVRDEMAVKHNQEKMRDFSDNASYVLMLTTDDGGKFNIITSEGEYYWDGRKRLKDKRFYSSYSVKNGKIRRMKSFPADDISDPALLSTFNDDLFFMKKTAQEGSAEENWALEKIIQ